MRFFGRLLLRLAFAALVATAAGARDAARAAPAGIHPRQLTITATVAAIDYANRAVTLAGPKGNSVVLVVARSVRNFEQVKQGDKVRVAYLEAVAIAVDDASGTKGPTASDAVQVVLPAKKPTVATVDTVELTATVATFDRSRRSVTLTLADGRSATVRIDPIVKDLSGLKPGAKVAIRLTQATAISVR